MSLCGKCQHPSSFHGNGAHACLAIGCTCNGMTTTLWVDAESGTWGSLTSLRLVEISNDQLDWFGEISDSERVRFAEEHGSEVDG